MKKLNVNASIKPSSEQMKLIVEGTYDCACMPYQYVNWAAEYLNKEPRYFAGGKMEIGALVDLFDVCTLVLGIEDGI